MIPNSVKPYHQKYEDAQALLVDALITLDQLRDEIYALPPEELTDIGYLLREISKFFDNARKDYNSVRELIELNLCKTMVENTLRDSEAEQIFRGVLASASPQVRQQPQLPKRGTEEYKQLCSWMGIPQKEIEKEYVTFHFPTLTKVLTDNAENGLPNPPGILGVIPKFACTFRKRNGETND